MFKRIGSFFKKKVTDKKPVTNQPIRFQDLEMHNISLEVKPSGNETVFVIHEEKTDAFIVLDQEQCLLVGAILTEYGNQGNILRILELIDKNTKKDIH